MLLGYAEQPEYFETLSAGALKPFGGKAALVGMMERAALATAEFHIEHSFADGVPFWDTGALRRSVFWQDYSGLFGSL